MPVDAIGGAAEWAIPQVEGLGGDAVTAPVTGDGAGAPSGSGFGSMLAGQIEGLAGLQKEAAAASRSLADGTATDPSQVVVAVERAQLAMQLASQLRTKSVDAISEVFRTQV